MDDKELIRMAHLARSRAYAPYSDFLVGAALLTGGGKVYLGCNIENASYGASNCAERTAFFKAVSEGETIFAKIAIVGGPQKAEAYSACYPCGICRQVMQEFCDPKSFQILLEGKSGELQTLTLEELLPLAFEKES